MGLVGVRGAVALAAVAACLFVPTGAADTPPTFDGSLTLAGPNDGQVGDTLSFTVTVGNNGPDPAAMELTISSTTAGSLRFAGSDGSCSQGSTDPNSNVMCVTATVEPGSQYVVHLRYQVAQRVSTSLGATVMAISGTDTDPSNDSDELQVFPPASIDNLTPPTISGSTSVGSVLSAGTGTWSPPWAYSYSYAWSRCIPPSQGSGCTQFTGGASYTLTATDAGCQMQVFVTASSELGSHTAASAMTDPVQPGGPCNLATSTSPPVASSGLQMVGSRLPPAAVGESYSAPIVTGRDPVHLAIVAGFAPPGFHTDDATGSLVGLTDAKAGTTWGFTIQATDLLTQQTDGVAYTLTLYADTAASTVTATARASLTRTPGVTNPAVTRADIEQTICRAAWITTHAPSKRFLARMKLIQMRQYGDSGPPSAFEEDELIPIVLGGTTRNPKNLWPEPRTRARSDDKLEAALHGEVCAGKLTLAAARRLIAHTKHTVG